MRAKGGLQLFAQGGNAIPLYQTSGMGPRPPAVYSPFSLMGVRTTRPNITAGLTGPGVGQALSEGNTGAVADAAPDTSHQGSFGISPGMALSAARTYAAAAPFAGPIGALAPAAFSGLVSGMLGKGISAAYSSLKDAIGSYLRGGEEALGEEAMGEVGANAGLGMGVGPAGPAGVGMGAMGPGAAAAAAAQGAMGPAGDPGGGDSPGGAPDGTPGPGGENNGDAMGGAMGGGSGPGGDSSSDSPGGAGDPGGDSSYRRGGRVRGCACGGLQAYAEGGEVIPEYMLPDRAPIQQQVPMPSLEELLQFKPLGGMADGGRLVDLLKKLPRRERFDALRENRLRNVSDENAMFATLRAGESPLAFYGPFPDNKLRGNLHFVPRSRQRFMMFDTSTPNAQGSATELGSMAANFGKEWAPQDLIDVDIAKPHQRQGWGRETLAAALSNQPDENARFMLWDVKRSAKKYWESLGAQMNDPSRPFRVKDKLAWDRDGFRDVERSQLRNNNYYITPGDFLDTVDRFAEGGSVEGDQSVDPRTREIRNVNKQIDQGSYAPYIVGGGLGAAGALALRPQIANSVARPLMRALAKPQLGMEAVSKHPLSPGESDARYNFARYKSEHDFSYRPVWRGQGAWRPSADQPWEFNPLYVQDLPRTMGPINRAKEHLRYAGQMGENLEQAATPLGRFVPNLINTSSDANAMMVSGIDRARLKSLAELLGDDVVTAHRPGDQALVFPLGDKSVNQLADEVNARFSFPRIRFGRSDPGKDRVLLSREPLGYEDATYEQVGARPRARDYETVETEALGSPGWRFGK